MEIIHLALPVAALGWNTTDLYGLAETCVAIIAAVIKPQANIISAVLGHIVP